MASAAEISSPELEVLVQGEKLARLPRDLFIPPDALLVYLEQFEGPLDLLLYLIRSHDFDIMTVSIAEITDHYLRYIELMDANKVELAGDYLLMSATLAEIKSRMLLPRQLTPDEEEEDPALDLRRRLRKYEIIQEAARKLEEIPRLGRDHFSVHIDYSDLVKKRRPPEVPVSDLVVAFAGVVERARLYRRHDVPQENFTLRECMDEILAYLDERSEFVRFEDLFEMSVNVRKIVVSFLAILELIRLRLLTVSYGTGQDGIYIRLINEVD